MLKSMGHQLFCKLMVVWVNDVTYLRKVRGNLFCLLQDLHILITERLGNSVHHLWESRSTIPVGGWVIGSAVEGFQVRGEKDGHGPTALTCHDLNGLHVDFI